jgi:hypothetical protein
MAFDHIITTSKYYGLRDCIYSDGNTSGWIIPCL